MTSRIRFDPESNNDGTGRVVDRRGQTPPGYTGQPIDRVMDAVTDIGSDIWEFVSREPFDNPFPKGSGLNPDFEGGPRPGHPQGGRPTTSHTVTDAMAQLAANKEGDQYMSAGEIARRWNARPINIFRAAVKANESSNPDGDYAAVRGMVRGTNRLLGAYGIAQDDWVGMAADSGIPGANWRDPRAQDRVAEQTMQRLHDKYQDWGLVAVAWKAGEKVADQIRSQPELLAEKALKGLSTYMESVLRWARDAVAVSGGNTEQMSKEVFRHRPENLLDGEPTSVGSMVNPEMNPLGPADDVEQWLRRRLYSMRERVRVAGDYQDNVDPIPPDEIRATEGVPVDTQSPEQKRLQSNRELAERTLFRRRRNTGQGQNRSNVPGSKGGVQEF